MKDTNHKCEGLPPNCKLWRDLLSIKLTPNSATYLVVKFCPFCGKRIEYSD